MPAIQVARTDTFELQRQKINQIGDQIFNISQGGSDLSTGNLKLGNGTVTSPSLSFTSDASVGIYKPSAGTLGFVSSNKKIVDLNSPIVLPEGYVPSDKEEFMNPMQVEYFRQKLLQWRQELLSDANDTLNTLSEENFQLPDITDRAQMESDASLQLRTRDRERKLLSKIESALRRIEDGSYGYCEETDEPISLKRLEARPIASLSLDAQERHERMEKSHRDD